MSNIEALCVVLGPELPVAYLKSLLDGSDDNVETAISMHFSSGGEVPACFIEEEECVGATSADGTHREQREQLIQMGFNAQEVDQVLEQVKGSTDVLQTAAGVLAAQDGEAEKLQAKLDKVQVQISALFLPHVTV